MSSLSTLHEAFDALERRADTLGHAGARPRDAGHAPRLRWAAPLAAAVVVAGAATGAAVLSQHHSTRAAPQAPAQARPTAASTHPTPRTSAPPTDAVPWPPRYLALTKYPDLAARVRTIVGPDVTITVDPARSASSQGSTIGYDRLGSSISGTLTANGHSGGYIVDDATTVPGTRTSVCQVYEIEQCTVRTYRGGSLGAGLLHTGGGRTEYVEYVRADGAQIDVIVSTLSDVKDSQGTRVTSAVLPLSVDQMIALATSDKW